VKIGKKLFFMLLSVLVILIGSIQIVNKFYLEKYYIEKKVDDLKEISKTIIDSDELIDLGEIEDNKGLIINLKPLTEEELLADVEKEYLSKYKDHYNKILKGESVIERVGYEGSVGEYIVLYRKYSEDIFIEISTPISHARELVDIATSFNNKIFLVVLILGGIISSITSKLIVKPILELKSITKDISELNFSNRFKYSYKDEIGSLGQSINKMGSLLEEAIGNLKTANEKLQQDIANEKRLEKLRREFIANVSHELKTPIALIQGYSIGLEDVSHIKEDRDFYTGVIIEESEKMNKLVEELLLISKIDSGYLKLNLESIDIDKLLKEAIGRYYLKIKEYEVKYKGEETFVIGDRRLVSRVIDNFIGNAFKYASKNSEIEVKIENINESVKITIKNLVDTKLNLEEIWTPFYRGDSSRSTDGNGLGLAIVKGILEEHKSSYGVELNKGEIEFYFTLNRS